MRQPTPFPARGSDTGIGPRLWTGVAAAAASLIIFLTPPPATQANEAPPSTQPAAAPTPVQVDPFPAVVQAVRPSVVGVGTYHFKDKPTVQYFGTGFVIGDGNTAVTNAHVVEAVQKQQRLPNLRVFFPNGRSVQGQPAQVVGQDRFHDLAILKFEGPPAPALTLRLDREPLQGQSVGILGYPIGFQLGLVPAVHRGVVSAIVPAVLPLPTGARMTEELAQVIRNPYDLYQLDLVVFPGNSGSPLFDAADGAVWGIINKTLAVGTREHLLSEPSGVGYAVPARWIHQLAARSAAADNNDQPLLGD